MTTLSPMVTPCRIVALEPIHTFLPNTWVQDRSYDVLPEPNLIECGKDHVMSYLASVTNYHSAMILK